MEKLLLILPVLFVQAVVFAQHSPETFRQLDKLEGTWVIKKGAATIVESWQKISENQYAGKSWIVKDGDSVLSETEILSFDDGVINYTSTVANQNQGKAVSFALTKAENNTYVFENPQHDFPKRIIYQFINDNELTASIDDGVPNTTNKSVYPFRRHTN